MIGMELSIEEPLFDSNSKDFGDVLKRAQAFSINIKNQLDSFDLLTGKLEVSPELL